MDGFDRIKLMESEIKNPFLSRIVEFLLTREDLKEMYLKEEKSLNEMLEFIEYKALMMCKNDRKKMPNGNGQYSSVILSDNQVYRWAALYFTFNNKYLGIEKMKKPQVVSNITQNVNDSKTAKSTKNNSEKETKTEVGLQKQQLEENIKKEEKEQMSLFN